MLHYAIVLILFMARNPYYAEDHSYSSFSRFVYYRRVASVETVGRKLNGENTREYPFFRRPDKTSLSEIDILLSSRSEGLVFMRGTNVRGDANKIHGPLDPRRKFGAGDGSKQEITFLQSGNVRERLHVRDWVRCQPEFHLLCLSFR